MAAEPTGAKRLRDLTADFQDGVGLRLRSERERHGVSLRELARRLEISPSALSQIETGRSRPSVGTLYAIVSELDMSLDELFGSQRTASRAAEAAGGAEETGATLVQRRDTRKGIELESGVRWERLTPTADQDVEFLYVVYEVGGASSRRGTHMRHMGREYGLVLSGTPARHHRVRRGARARPRGLDRLRVLAPAPAGERRLRARRGDLVRGGTLAERSAQARSGHVARARVRLLGPCQV